jgi:FKBP-type peptidyl-prolyl cis-trans isomerase
MKKLGWMMAAGAAALVTACSSAPPATDEEAIARARDCNTPEDTAIPQVDAPDSARNPQANAEAAEAYLEMARGERCVFELDSGLVFRIREAAGEDALSPERGDLVTVHYRGLFPHGEEFDSSYSRGQPATFPSDRLIDGWVEALPLMRVGETWELYIPPDLGYGTRGTPGGPIGPNQALVFQLELVALPGAEPDEAGEDR